MALSIPTMSAIRFGYGIRPGETLPETVEDLLAQLQAGQREKPRFPVEGIEQRYTTIAALNRKRAAITERDPKLRKPKLRKIREEMRDIYQRDRHARIVQAVFSPHGFYERLAFFWLNHFSVNAQKTTMCNLYVGVYEAEALRPNLAGPFSTLLKAAIRHPAMLLYLDQVRSAGPNSRRALSDSHKRKAGLNENLGRELLELHTLGVDGGYNQENVREAALLLTGLGIERYSGKGVFRPNFAEPGTLELLGKSYERDGEEGTEIDKALDDLSIHPSTARHICRKLAVHFISDTPDAKLVDAMINAWQASNGNLSAVYEAMLRHPAAWEEPGQKARQPLDYIIACLRALEVPIAALGVPSLENSAPAANMEMMDMNDAAKAEPLSGVITKTNNQKSHLTPDNALSVRILKQLGQDVWQPPSPAGFEERFDKWIASGQLTSRIEYASKLAKQFGGRKLPQELLREVLRDAARQETITIAGQAPNRAAGLALVLSSPEFNRR
jgi:uncharacterized protein (DUF1800 family)